jgi:hypothetical protein
MPSATASPATGQFCAAASHQSSCVACCSASLSWLEQLSRAGLVLGRKRVQVGCGCGPHDTGPARLSQISIERLYRTQIELLQPRKGRRHCKLHHIMITMAVTSQHTVAVVQVPSPPLVYYGKSCRLLRSTLQIDDSQSHARGLFGSSSTYARGSRIVSGTTWPST